MTLTEVKCMIRVMYVAITTRGSGGLCPPDVGMTTQISAPLLESTSNALARGSGGMLSRKIFEILRGVYDAICSNIFDLCVLTSGQEWIQKILVWYCDFELS